jgi:hypothetical protein
VLKICSKCKLSKNLDDFADCKKAAWHVDHIIPCSSFDLTDSEQQKKCFHYTNLQPLWAIDNLKKSNKILTKA